MIYRQIVGSISNEYEGTPEEILALIKGMEENDGAQEGTPKEIKVMLKAECNHTGAYDHAALNTGNGIEMVCLRCEKDRSNKDNGEITYRTTEEGYLQSVHGDNVFTLTPMCINCNRSLKDNETGPLCDKCAECH